MYIIHMGKAESGHYGPTQTPSWGGPPSPTCVVSCVYLPKRSSMAGSSPRNGLHSSSIHDIAVHGGPAASLRDPWGIPGVYMIKHCEEGLGGPVGSQ